MEKKNNQNIVVKATIWYTISNILLKSVSLFTAPIFTRLLDPADYGIATNFLSWTNIISCVTGLGLTTAVMRGKIEYKNEFYPFLSSLQFLGMSFTLLCSIIMLSTSRFWEGVTKLDSVCIGIMLIYLLFYQSLEYAQTKYRFDYEYKKCVAISVANAFGNVILSIILVLALPNQKYLGRILGQAVPYIIIGGYFAIRFFIKGKTLFSKRYWAYAIRLGIPVIPHSLAMIILAQVDRVMIVNFIGESEAGIYSFGYSYSILLSVITNAINYAVQPQMYDALNNRDDKRLRILTDQIMMGVFFLVCIQIVLAPEALMLLGTKEYFDARWVVFPVVIGTMLQFVYQNFSVVEIYYNKTICMSIGSIGAAIVNYFLNTIFIPKNGYIAAAYTTLVSYGLLMIFHYIMSCVVAKRKVYNIFILLKYPLLTLVVGMIINFFYDFPWFYRYIFAGLIVSAIVIFKYKELSKLCEYSNIILRKKNE